MSLLGHVYAAPGAQETTRQSPCDGLPGPRSADTGTRKRRARTEVIRNTGGDRRCCGRHVMSSQKSSAEPAGTFQVTVPEGGASGRGLDQEGWKPMMESVPCKSTRPEPSLPSLPSEHIGPCGSFYKSGRHSPDTQSWPP